MIFNARARAATIDLQDGLVAIGARRPTARLAAYIAVILAIMYVPMLVVGLASISKSRFFLFPIRRTSSKWC